MRTGAAPFHTPPEPDDGVHQPRERAVRCIVHLHMPTWRRDGRCTICLEAAA